MSPWLILALLWVQAGVAGETIIFGAGSPGPYRLAHKFLLLGSDSVFIDGGLVSRDLYQLDYDRGWLRFKDPIPDTSLIRASYHYLPLNIPETNHLKGANPAQDRAKPDESDLRAQGAKVVGVELGPGGLDLVQSLNLKISGEMAGVEIKAQLSDQETPLPPQGTTQKLSQLDRILIELTHPNFAAQLGDCELRLDLGRFGTLAEYLEGGIGRAMIGKSRIDLGLMRAPGQPGHKELMGQAGCQGPYPLTGSEAGIVPGSEQVWLDGVPMRRGWDADYIIDYETGELTFTNHRLITDRDRIEAQFQYAAQPYERLTYNLGGQYSTGALNIELQGYEEGDDPSRSLEYELSAEDRAYLAEIGDDTARAWLPGERWVGDNQGEYVWDLDHFAYVGPGQGEYQVRFSRVSEGEYVYDLSLPGFRWVGPGAGDYTPKFRAALPERQRLTFARLGYKPAKGFGLSLEGIFTAYDANRFSTRDDGDNQGLGYGLGVSYEAERWNLGYVREDRARSLALPGELRPLDFRRRWGEKPDTGFTTDEFLGTLTPIPGLKLTGELGYLDKRLGRYQLSLAYRDLLDYRLEGVKLERRHELNLGLPVKLPIQPRVRWRREERPLECYNKYGLDFGLKPSPPLSLGITYEIDRAQKLKSLTGLWVGVVEDQLYRISATVNHNNLDLGANLGYRTRYPLETLIESYKDYFADLIARYQHRRGWGFGLEFHRTRVAMKGYTVEYYWVGEGKGAYSRDPESGRFYPDPEGDYERLIRPELNPIPAQDSRLNAEMRLAGYEKLQLRVLVGLSLKGDHTSPLFQTANINLILSVLPYNPLISWELEGSRNVSQDRLSQISYRSLTDQTSILTRSHPCKILQLSLRNLLIRQSRFEAAEHEYEEDGYEVSLEPTLFLPIEFSIKAGLTRSRLARPLSYPELGRFPLSELQLGLGANTDLAQTVIRGDLNWVHRQSPAPFWPYDLQISRPLGTTITWRLGAERLLSQQLTLSFDYSGEVRPEGELDHRLNSYLKAYF